MSDLTFKGIFKGKQSKVEQKMNVDSGLLSRLEEDGIITNIQRTTIEVTCVRLLFVSFNVIIKHTLHCSAV